MFGKEGEEKYFQSPLNNTLIEWYSVITERESADVIHINFLMPAVLATEERKMKPKTLFSGFSCFAASHKSMLLCELGRVFCLLTTVLKKGKTYSSLAEEGESPSSKKRGTDYAPMYGKTYKSCPLIQPV